MSIYQGDTKIAGAINFGNKANIDSPALTGIPTAPTATVGTNTGQLATTSFVNAEIANDAPTKTGSGASGTWEINITGNAVTTTKLATARTISLAGDVTGSVSTDLSANASITTTVADDSHSHSTNTLYEPNYMASNTPFTAASSFDVLRADRTAFLPADQIIIEQSTDGGTTWVDAGISDSNKRRLFTGQRPTLSIPLKNGVQSTDCMIRATITAMKYNVPGGTGETDKYSYWNSTYVTGTERYCTINRGWIWLCSLANKIYAKVEVATGGASTSWVTAREGYLTGWSGGNFLSINNCIFGGGSSQTGNYWNWRLTFRTCSNANTFNDADLSTSYNTSMQSINHIKFTGKDIWISPNYYAYNDHMYTWDEYKNVSFPAGVQGNQLTSTVATGTAPLVVTSTTKVSSLNVDKLDDQEGSYYLDWTNITNKPDPVITLAGDATGSVTLTDMTSGTLTVAVADDSHNHIISNVDGLQAALDAKAPLAHVGATGSAHGTATSSVNGFMSSSDFTKLNGIATGANNYIHPTGDGNMHVPANGTTNSGKVLKAGATAGSLSWGTLTSTDVGLGNVNNTTDTDKPVSTATQTALNAKAPLDSPALTGIPTAPTAAAGTNTTQVATTAFVYNEAPFVISATAPTNTNKLWIDNNGIAYFYNGTDWVSIKGTYAD